ncbi:MAG TPA: hypothetical protein VK789_07455 [Bryobacteraceae bacterium]|nr:hypothetical protein [Bryobacteraceae bacterium]
MTERTIAATTHGRCLVIPPATAGPAPMLVGFHGYAEDAETQLERLRAIPEASRWLIVSIQGLHRFYQRRTDRVVASWMTRQDRELAIADNIAYVQSCIEALSAEWPVKPAFAFAGFSQGVAAAFRAAANWARGSTAVLAVGGDVPPDLDASSLKRISASLIARGTADEWYTKEKFAEDERRLGDAGGAVRAVEFVGGHEWPAEINEAASNFLGEFVRR